jgi:hypothetical protein
MPEPIPNRGVRQAGQEGGEILPVDDYRNEGKRWCELLTGLVVFSLVAPPL